MARIVGMPGDFFSAPVIQGRVATVTLRFFKQTKRWVAGKDQYGADFWFDRTKVKFEIEPRSSGSSRLCVTGDVREMARRKLVKLG